MQITLFAEDYKFGMCGQCGQPVPDEYQPVLDNIIQDDVCPTGMRSRRPWTGKDISGWNVQLVGTVQNMVTDETGVSQVPGCPGKQLEDDEDD